MEPSKTQTQTEYSENVSCPITFLTIVNDDDEADEFKAKPGYTVVEAPRNELYIVFTKTQTDTLPVTNTQIGKQPCIDPKATFENRAYYPTELDRKRGRCEVDDDVGTSQDTRFQELDFQISEMQLMDESGVT